MKTAVFYLYIMMMGVEADPIPAGKYESLDVCKALGQKITADINQQPQIVAAGNVTADFKCTAEPLRQI